MISRDENIHSGLAKLAAKTGHAKTARAVFEKIALQGDFTGSTAAPAVATDQRTPAQAAAQATQRKADALARMNERNRKSENKRWAGDVDTSGALRMKVPGGSIRMSGPSPMSGTQSGVAHEVRNIAGAGGTSVDRPQDNIALIQAAAARNKAIRKGVSPGGSFQQLSSPRLPADQRQAHLAKIQANAEKNLPPNQRYSGPE